MRILFLCHRIPYPPDKGEKIRAFHELRALSERHDVDLFTLVDDPADMVHVAALRKYCARLTIARISSALSRLLSLPRLLSRNPLTLPYFHSRKLSRELVRTLSTRSYDRIVIYCSAMGQYVTEITGIPIITDFVDVDSDKWMQYARQKRLPVSLVCRREGVTLRAYERRLAQLSARVVVSTEREAELMRQIDPDSRVSVIPNGVDSAYFSPAAVKPVAGPPTVIFTGDMSYLPNVEAVTSFARHVLPLIRNRISNVRFIIVGRRPTGAVRKLATLDGVTVTGFVPDIRDYLCRAQVAVAPFAISAGIPNKILEALSYGLPVVSTSRGLQGLRPELRSMLEPVDTAIEMAAQIEYLLGNSEIAQRRGAEARSFVMNEYRWEVAMNRLLGFIENPLGGVQETRAVAYPARFCATPIRPAG